MKITVTNRDVKLADLNKIQEANSISFRVSAKSNLTPESVRGRLREYLTQSEDCEGVVNRAVQLGELPLYLEAFNSGTQLGC